MMLWTLKTHGLVKGGPRLKGRDLTHALAMSAGHRQSCVHSLQPFLTASSAQSHTCSPSQTRRRQALMYYCREPGQGKGLMPGQLPS